MTNSVKVFLEILSLLTLVAVGTSECPDGFDLVNSNCLTISTKRFTHHKAALYCQELNSHLVYLKNAIDNTVIINYASNITTPMWIGLTCNVNKDPKQCKWDDGSYSSYTNFLPGYPVTNIGTCVYIDSSNQPLRGRWISATCALDEYHAVCETEFN